MYHFVPIDFIPISQIFLHHLKYITKILIDSYVKISDKNYWYARFWKKLLKLPQGAFEPHLHTFPYKYKAALGSVHTELLAIAMQKNG